MWTSGEARFSGVLDAVSGALDDAVLGGAGGALSRARVIGIGLTGLAESGVVLDGAGRRSTSPAAEPSQRSHNAHADPLVPCLRARVALGAAPAIQNSTG